MGDMTVTNLVRRVARNIGISTPTAGSDEATDIEQALNWAQKLIMRKHRFSCMERTDSSQLVVASQLRYELPPQVCEIIDVRLIDDTCYVLADCESGWTAGASTTISYDSDYRREGRYGLKMNQTGDESNLIVAYSADQSSTQDISGITAGAIGFWIYSDTALSSGDLEITITEDSNGARTTQYVTCTVPAVSAYTWTYVKLTTDSSASALDLSSAGTLIDAYKSIGVWNAGTDLTDSNIYIDGLMLYDQDYGGYNWQLYVMTSNQLDRNIPNPAYIAENRPTTIAISGGEVEGGLRTFEVYPIPDTNYPVWWRYYKWPQDLDYTNNASAKSELDDLDQALIAGASWIEFGRIRNWESANQYQAIFYRALKESSVADDKSDSWRPQMTGHVMSMGNGLGDIDIPAETQGDARGTNTGYYTFT